MLELKGDITGLVGVEGRVRGRSTNTMPDMEETNKMILFLGGESGEVNQVLYAALER